MEPAFAFPLDGWRFDGSFSYGQADAYRDIPHVVVNIFPEAERAVAENTYRFLKENGLETATIDEVEHTDGKVYVYVWAERDEFLAGREKLYPNVRISPRVKRRP